MPRHAIRRLLPFTFTLMPSEAARYFYDYFDASLRSIRRWYVMP